MTKKNNIKNIPSIKIIGLGNLLSGNDGIGIRIVQKLYRTKNKYDCLKNVEIIDLGTCGLDLLNYFENTNLLILIDAISSDKKIGTILKIYGNNLINEDFSFKISSFHDISIIDILNIGSKIYNLPKIILFGIVIDNKNITDNYITNLTLKIDSILYCCINKVISLIIEEIELFIKRYYFNYDLNHE